MMILSKNILCFDCASPCGTENFLLEVECLHCFLYGRVFEAGQRLWLVGYFEHGFHARSLI